MDLAAHARALLVAGQPLPIVGRLLTDRTVRGAEVVLDGDTGREARASEGTWVLSDEGDATDGHILRQFWNLRRGNAAINVLYDHGQSSSPKGSMPMGRWEDFAVVAGLPDTVGRATTARIRWAEDIDWIDEVRKLVDQRILVSVSTRWIPGAIVRRGELDPSDPHWSKAIDGPCGPEEGFVMGSEAEPNEMIENSLTPTPAQSRAYARTRLDEGAGRALDAVARGVEPTEADLSRLLARLANEPRVRAYLQHLIAAEVRRHTPAAAPPRELTLSDLLTARNPHV